MINPRRSIVWLTAGAGLALAATALETTQQVMADMVDHGHDWWRILVWQLAGWCYWAVVTPVLLLRGGALARSHQWWRALPLAIVTPIALIALHILAVSTVVVLVQHFQPVAVYSFAQAVGRQFHRWLYVDIVAGTGLIFLGFALENYQRARQLELNETRLGAELARAELEALRLQMRPHFLFNSLNSIAALIRRGDADQALSMTLDLGELMRETVGRSQRDLVPLADELSFLERYVQLQRTRFGERLQVNQNVPAECLSFGAPTLSLQPLVENAIRHGLAGRRGALRIDIEARVADGQLLLQVMDNGPGLAPGFDLDKDSGVGVGNLRSRLKRMFNGAGGLQLETRLDGGTMARLSFPAIMIDREAAP